MDDTTLIANNRKSLQSMLQTTEELYHINDIQANPLKTKLITINSTKLNQDKGVTLCSTKIIPVPKNEAIRILGIWINEAKNKKHQLQIIMNKVHTNAKILKFKKITDKQCRYIINQVIFPTIEYLLNDMILT